MRKRRDKNSRNGLEILGRFRMGNKARVNEYWKKEEEKLCRACMKEVETMKYILMDCEITGKDSMD